VLYFDDDFVMEVELAIHIYVDMWPMTACQGVLLSNSGSSSEGIWSISVKSWEWEGVASVEKMSEKASKFAIRSYCNGDERIIAINDFPDNFIC
jgi:hypothetical protein